MSTVTITILSAGKTMDPTYEVVSVDILKEVNRIPSAQIVLLDGSAAEQKFAISDDAFFEPGKEVEIKLRYESDPGGETTVFKGLVVKQVVEASQDGTLLTVELKDAAIKLAQTRRSEVYLKKKDTAIFEQLIKNGGLDKGTVDDTKVEHPEIVQYYSTDWDFMLSRAGACGLLVIAEDGALSVQEIALDGEPDEKHTFEFGKSLIYNFEMEVDASSQRGEVASIAWDLKNQKLTQASKAKAFNLSQGDLKAGDLAEAVGGKQQTLSSPVPADPKALQAWADAVMTRSRMAMIRGCLAIQGVGDIHRLEMMKVAGVGERFNGKTLVTGVRHRVDANGWQTDVQFGLSPEAFVERRDIVDVPAAGLLPGVNGLQIGVVDKYEDDPDKEFRVKVILPGIDETKGAVWARLASPDAGKDRGYFFRPEQGDEVVVGFLNDDPRHPVILGAMYSSKNTLAKDMQVSKENTTRGIVSRTGITLAFTDDKKPLACLKTPGPNKITLDDDGKMIEIEDQNGNKITMDKDGIKIQSAKDLKIEASGNVEIKGSKVDVK